MIIDVPGFRPIGEVHYNADENRYIVLSIPSGKYYLIHHRRIDQAWQVQNTQGGILSTHDNLADAILFAMS